MKKAIFTLALILSIGATQVSLASSAPKHRYHPTTQQVDKQAAAGQAAAVQDDEAIAAYSDTTATDTSDYADVDDNANHAYHSKYSLGNYDDPFDFIGSVFGGGALSVIIIFCIMEMAMEKGINVPESDRPIDKQSDEYLVKRGLRNAFLGAGLCAMFAWWEADFLAGIGALVFFYGLGQTLIGSLPAIKDWWRSRHGNQGTGYNGTPV